MGRIRGGGKEWLRSQTTPYVAKREYTSKKKKNCERVRKSIKWISCL